MSKDDWETYRRQSEYGPKDTEKAPDYRVHQDHVHVGSGKPKKRSLLSRIFPKKGQKK